MDDGGKLVIQFSPIGCVMDCYTPHPGSIPLSDVKKLQDSTESNFPQVPSSKWGKGQVGFFGKFIMGERKYMEGK